MPQYTLKVNGTRKTVAADADTPLLYVPVSYTHLTLPTN